jgi:hypothetical protein
MDDTKPAEWLDKIVLVTKGSVYFGETKPPGLIAEHGISVILGDYDINTMTVTFQHIAMTPSIRRPRPRRMKPTLGAPCSTATDGRVT